MAATIGQPRCYLLLAAHVDHDVALFPVLIVIVVTKIPILLAVELFNALLGLERARQVHLLFLLCVFFTFAGDRATEATAAIGVLVVLIPLFHDRDRGPSLHASATDTGKGLDLGAGAGTGEAELEVVPVGRAGRNRDPGDLVSLAGRDGLSHLGLHLAQHAPGAGLPGRR